MEEQNDEWQKIGIRKYRLDINQHEILIAQPSPITNSHEIVYIRLSEQNPAKAIQAEALFHIKDRGVGIRMRGGLNIIPKKVFEHAPLIKGKPGLPDEFKKKLEELVALAEEVLE